MDNSTAKHFDNWLNSIVLDDIREQVRDLMLAEYRNDPELYNRSGWQVLYSNIHHLINFDLGQSDKPSHYATVLP